MFLVIFIVNLKKQNIMTHLQIKIEKYFQIMG